MARVPTVPRLLLGLPLGLLLIGATTGCYEVQPIIRGTSCSTVVDELEPEIYEVPLVGCTAVLDYNNDFMLEQWQLVCNREPDAPIDEMQARIFTDCCEDPMGTPAVNRDDPSDAFVFFGADDMGNGNIAVVSRPSAALAYEASLSAGEPSVAFPSTGWRPATDLATDCNSEALTDVNTYDENGDIPVDAQMNLEDSIRRTGIPDAMRANGGGLRWTVLLRAGAGNISGGRWVALLHSDPTNYPF